MYEHVEFEVLVLSHADSDRKGKFAGIVYFTRFDGDQNNAFCKVDLDIWAGPLAGCGASSTMYGSGFVRKVKCAALRKAFAIDHKAGNIAIKPTKLVAEDPVKWLEGLKYDVLVVE